jgi:hypothetical protein
MSILPMISFFLIATLLMSMLAKARPWSKAAVPGKALKTLPMNLLSRMWVQRFSLFALLTGLVFGVVAGWLPVNIAGMVAAFAFVIVLMPMQLTLTTQGVGIGQAMFRPWSDFSGFKTKKSSLELLQSSAFGRLTLFIKPAEMSNVLKHVERHIQYSSPKS